MPSAVLDTHTGTYTIPAAHTNRLAAILAGKQSAPVPVERIVQQVISQDAAHIYEIPATAILKLTNCEKSTELVLCATFQMHTGKCADGDRCKRVHADVSGCRKYTPHVNFAWTGLDAVEYPRHPGGQVLSVAAPGSKRIVDVVPTEYMLVTKALERDSQRPSHCAHYYFNRTCNLGAECQFIHAVFIDPNAKPNQRAPAPAQLRSKGAAAAPVAPAASAVSRPPLASACGDCVSMRGGCDACTSSGDDSDWIGARKANVPPSPTSVQSSPMTIGSAAHELCLSTSSIIGGATVDPLVAVMLFRSNSMRNLQTSSSTNSPHRQSFDDLAGY